MSEATNLQSQAADVLAFGYNWAATHLFTREAAIEVTVLLLAVLVSWWMSKYIWRWMEPYAQRESSTAVIRRLWSTIRDLRFPASALIVTALGQLVATQLEYSGRLLMIVSSLLMAWIVIRLAAVFVKNPLLSSLISTVAWVIAALNVLGLLGPVSDTLAEIHVPLGSPPITALMVVRALLTLGVLLWVATAATNLIDSRLRLSPNITPSIQVLSSKLIKIIVITGAVLFAAASVGINLSALAIFGGAVGVGLGFGLQKIFGNLISGFILLLDKSIKPGDVIAVQDYFGRVDQLGARYVSVWTRDGIEHLIPNEDLIVNRVENWSHSNNLLRLRIPIGVHYKSDVHLARSLVLEAADEVPRVLSNPAPNCLLRGFGDSSVDLELRLWINDPMNGRANVTSDVLIKVWDKFHANGVEIPYPQRDLHLRSAVPVEMAAAAGDSQGA